MARLTRRGFIGAGIAGAAAATVRPVAAQAPGAPPHVYRFFTPVEAAFVEAAVDRLIPPDPEFGGAVEAGVPVFIDLQLDGSYGRGDRLYLRGPWAAGTPGQGYQLALTPAQLYRTALGAIAALPADQEPPFAERDGAGRDDFLRRLEAGELDLGGVPSSVFFETLLANTIEGFFSDPIYGGNRDKVGWRMVGFPGAYAAFLDLYRHHGMRYDRAPLSIADLG